ncbi:lysophospholipid acyltransferase family protein [Cognatilysobacter lacus]|uniref:1-acyl-sn-glycerol-3-phosphate acyltransferase n=1 Tax=Cognatilysobacter lacus TaxID=1643323 RepID=A0A5D8YJD4_9GAMM|nr:lysophospholipid acyltransferase family protein [Lysobacter lacus]TZF82875.1 1-acyl-sn-glycerol-3-phosphate acyltransferase [Lysobacter lacus]
MIAPTSPDGAASPGGVVLRVPRYLIRVPLLLWHALVHLPLLLLLLTPPTRAWRWGDELFQHRAIRMWQWGLMWIVGFRLRRAGTPLAGATMFVANHVGWVDISMLHTQRMMGFVAKDEIARWPLIGTLAARAQTIYHRRGNAESLGGVMSEMVRQLRAGHSVGVFPEGGTRGGGEIGPFHARIFTAAVEAGAPVQPVALVYGEHGAAQRTVAFAKGETFFANFLRLLGEPARSATVHFLEPIPAGTEEGRRRIAELARQRIVDAMGT